MDYGKYKNARNAAWQCILDFNINQLPVIVTDIINQSDNIRLYKDSNVQLLRDGESGITVFNNGGFEIVYKNSEPSYRCRFTIAHELGHIFLGHLLIKTPAYRTFVTKNDNESAANIFARDLLAPACVLHELGIVNAVSIAKLCDISREAATYREDRMKELECRNAWYFNRLEREVYNQFNNFIIEKNNNEREDR